MFQPKDVSIIVPVYNGGAAWTRCLDALMSLEPAPAEIIVVDDGSTDGSREQACTRGLEVLTSPSPRSGPGLARNHAATRARGDVLFFVDSDVLVPPDAVARVVAAFADPRVGAIFGSYDDAPADKSFFSQYKNLIHHYVHQNSSEEATSFWAGCGAVRKAAFDQVNGFAPVYRRASIEDIELGYRLRHAGYRIRLVKNLQAKHLKRWTWRSLVMTDIFSRAIPWAGLILCERELPADLNLKKSDRLSTILCFLLPVLLLGLFFSPWIAGFIVLIACSLVTLNLDLYEFFARRRGLLFTVRTIPLHWFYFFYSGLAFFLVVLLDFIRFPRYMFGSIFLARFQRQPQLDRSIQAPE